MDYMNSLNSVQGRYEPDKPQKQTTGKALIHTPTESAVRKEQGHRSLNVIVILRVLSASVLALLMYGCADKQKEQRLALPATITNVADGYPFALQMKTVMFPEAYLTAVLVNFSGPLNRWEVAQMTYAFHPLKNGCQFIVSLDNHSRTAFAYLGWRLTHEGSVPVPLPINLSSIAKDVQDVMEIAKTTGIAEPSLFAPGSEKSLYFLLRGPQTGAVWHVRVQEPMDTKAVACVDARSGTVIDCVAEQP